ncbi:MAG: Hsp20 family protein [bacterium]|jgi:HSP20 family molecular chaperone IbpA
MNNKLLLAVVISATATSHAFSKLNDVGESIGELVKTIGEEFKQLPSMILPNTIRSLKLVSSADDKEYRYQLAIPGKNKSNVTATVDHATGTITISVQGDASEATETTKDGVHTTTVVQSSHAFKESLKAPRHSNLHAVEITVQDGLLTLTIPKEVIPGESAVESITVN